MQAASQNANNISYYSVLVFKDQLQRQEFFTLLRTKEEEYVDGNKIINIIKEKIKKT